jgi:DNA-binding transcriptional LysR family regulator
MLDNLDRLKTFYFVYASGSVGKAAKALHVTQPAVSQAVQKLESEIKTPLFVRQHKKIIPTAAGTRLYGVVEPFMRDLEACLASLAFAQDEPFGDIRIGAPLEFGKAYLPAILTTFRKQYPNVTFHLKLGATETHISQVEQGELDFALVDLFLVHSNEPFANTPLQYETVVHENIILACSSEYFKTELQTDMSLEHLLKQDFLEYSPGSRTIEYWFKHHFRTSKINFHTAMILDSHATLIQAIKLHNGLGILASHLVEEDLLSGEIIPITTSGPGIINEISLVQLQNKEPSLTERMFKEHLLGEIKNLGL